MTKIGLSVGIAFAVAAAVAGAAAAKTQLTVYTALEQEQLGPYQEAFEKANPDIEIVWVRDATGVITARLLLEKARPRADAILGLAVTSFMLLQAEGMIEAYAPKGVEDLKPNFRDGASPPGWIGMDAYMAAICYNTVEGARRNVPRPASWKDLARPEYKGQVLMPNPVSSGTGFLMVSGWLQSMGEEAGWKFMDALHENIAVYPHSGSAPCLRAANGEQAVGLSFAYRAAKEKTSGAPIDVILPAEGVGWDMEASGIHKRTKHLAEAKALMDWAASKEASLLYNRYYGVVAYPGVASDVPNYPKDAEAKMIRNDFAYATRNRDAILAEWTRRYDAKSVPRR